MCTSDNTDLCPWHTNGNATFAETKLIKLIYLFVCQNSVSVFYVLSYPTARSLPLVHDKMVTAWNRLLYIDIYCVVDLYQTSATSISYDLGTMAIVVMLCYLLSLFFCFCFCFFVIIINSMTVIMIRIVIVIMIMIIAAASTTAGTTSRGDSSSNSSSSGGCRSSSCRAATTFATTTAVTSTVLCNSISIVWSAFT